MAWCCRTVGSAAGGSRAPRFQSLRHRPRQEHAHADEAPGAALRLAPCGYPADNRDTPGAVCGGRRDGRYRLAGLTRRKPPVRTRRSAPADEPQRMRLPGSSGVGAKLEDAGGARQGARRFRAPAGDQRLTQVVSNVLGNAAKYTDPGGRIHLRVSQEGGQTLIRVRDSGLGIPAGQLEQVFAMFAQVPEHRARAGGGGLGIGLALSRRLVELHGGTIVATSEGLGQGSEFLIRLPLAAAAEASDEITRPNADDAHGIWQRILIIEDNVDAADSLRAGLESQGHAVRTARTAPEGLGMVEEFSPEVV